MAFRTKGLNAITGHGSNQNIQVCPSANLDAARPRGEDGITPYPFSFPMIRSLSLRLPRWLICAVLFASLLFQELHPTVVLNEIMASNGNSLEDEEGDNEDWIELLNTGSHPVDLGGWTLSDRDDRPARWIFPSTTLAPGARLLIWASGKNRRVASHPLHTNFSIATEGERILLSRPDGSLADHLQLGYVPQDVSFGRAPDGANVWRYFEAPTPLEPNPSIGMEKALVPPILSHEAGFYTEPVSLSVHTPDPNATLRYTLDGSTPTLESPEYTGTLLLRDRSPEDEILAKIRDTGGGFALPQSRIAKGTPVRIRAFGEGAIPSPVLTATYFVGIDPAKRYPHMPIITLAFDTEAFFSSTHGIYVNQNWNNRGVEWERVAHMEFFETDGAKVIDQNIGVRIHGGASRNFAKKSLRLYARSAYGRGRFNHRIFPELPYDRYNRLILRNGGNGTDRGIVQDGLMQQLVSGMLFDTQAYRPAIVFLNGEYWGVHNIRERYDRHYIERVHGVDPNQIDLLSGHDSADEGDNTHFRAMMNYIEANDLADPSHYAEVQTRMDTANFIDYQIAQIFLNNTDWPGNNITFWRKRTAYDPHASGSHDGRWRWLMFDVDFGYNLYWASGNPASQHNEAFNTLAFATAQNGPTVGTSSNWPNPPWSTRLLRELLRNNTFRRDFINRFTDQLNTTFLPDHNYALLEKIWDLTWPGYPANKSSAQPPEGLENVERWPAMLQGWGPANAWRGMRVFALARRDHVFTHLRTEFNLSEPVNITIDNATPEYGSIQINSIRIDSETIGLADASRPYPWTGTYVRGHPITLTAHPKPGYSFLGWEGITETDSLVELTPTKDLHLRARFGDRISYDEWRNRVYPDETDPAVSGPYAIAPYGRLELSNLYRYAFGLDAPDDPHAPAATLPQPARAENGFELQIPWPGNRLDVFYQVEELSSAGQPLRVLFDSRFPLPPESSLSEGLLALPIDPPDPNLPARFFRVVVLPAVDP